MDEISAEQTQIGTGSNAEFGVIWGKGHLKLQCTQSTLGLLTIKSAKNKVSSGYLED